MTGQKSQRGRDRESVGRAVTCSSGKLGYVSRKTAKDAAHKARTSGPMRPYACTECGLWHIGHKPKAVIRGEVSSTDWYAGKSARGRHTHRRHQPPHDGAGDHLEQRAAE